MALRCTKRLRFLVQVGWPGESKILRRCFQDCGCGSGIRVTIRARARCKLNQITSNYLNCLSFLFILFYGQSCAESALKLWPEEFLVLDLERPWSLHLMERERKNWFRGRVGKETMQLEEETQRRLGLKKYTIQYI